METDLLKEKNLSDPILNLKEMRKHRFQYFKWNDYRTKLKK